MKTTFWDGKLQENKLGNYVYALVDPRDDSVFYVGLAGGLEGQGNNRPDEHLIEAAKKTPSEKLSPKQAKIKEIWESKGEPKLIIVRRNLDRKDAKHIEAALIDLFNHLQHEKCLILTNEQRGHWVKEHSIVTANNLAELFADPVKPASEILNVWLFNIKNALKEGKSPYEAAQGDWRIKNKHHLVIGSYAVGLLNGISRVVIEIEGWSDGVNDKKKKSFQGKVINGSELGRQLFEKDFSNIIKVADGYWKRGNPILVDFQLPNKVKIVRGVKGGAEIQT